MPSAQIALVSLLRVASWIARVIATPSCCASITVRAISGLSASSIWVTALLPSRCVIPLENFFTRTSIHWLRRTFSSSTGMPSRIG